MKPLEDKAEEYEVEKEVGDGIFEGDGPSIRKHSAHHHHKHHHSKHKHKNRRKESEVLPQLTDAEEPIRDVKCTYDFPLKSAEYLNKSLPGMEGDVSVDIDEPSQSNGIFAVEVDYNDGSDNDLLVRNEYVPNLPAYHYSPSKQFSPYADTPLLDRSKKEMTERDKEVLIEAKRKHSAVKLSNLNNSPHSGVKNSQLSSSPPDHQLADVAVDILDPWASPPLIIVDHHMEDLSETNI